MEVSIQKIDRNSKKVILFVDFGFGRYVFDLNEAKYEISITTCKELEIRYLGVTAQGALQYEVRTSITEYQVTHIYSANKFRLSRQWFVEFEYKEQDFIGVPDVKIEKKRKQTLSKQEIWKIKDYIDKNGADKLHGLSSREAVKLTTKDS